MAQPQFLLLAAILAIGSFQYSQGYKPCVVAKASGVDEAWFIEAAAKGFHIVEHSNCDNCENEEAWQWLKGSGRSTQKKMCWTMDVTTQYGAFSLPYTCKYNDISKEECELNTSKSILKDKLQMGGRIVLTHTDNSTYVAGTLCVFDKENLWWIMTTNADKTLPGSAQQKIKEELHAMGFKKGNLAVSGKSPLYVTQMSASPDNC